MILKLFVYFKVIQITKSEEEKPTFQYNQLIVKQSTKNRK